MRRWLFAILAISMLAVATACNDDSPTDPSDETVTFLAQLSPAQEVPPVTGIEASGSGTARIVLRLERNSSNAITDAAADFQVTLAGFPQNTAVTTAHIHEGETDDIGDIVVNTGVAAGQVTLTIGTVTFVREDINVSPTLAQRIIDDADDFYFDVHSALNVGGMVRGQLVKQ
jgi:CHRD domain